MDVVYGKARDTRDKNIVYDINSASCFQWLQITENGEIKDIRNTRKKENI